jgi:CMP-2-keto-3-deoxyoctulosonic acid synthetase
LNEPSLSALLDVLKRLNKEIDLGSLMIPLVEKDEIENPNNVKVIVDQNHCALYFSRSPIPFYRDKIFLQNYSNTMGVYAFRKEALFILVIQK